MERRRDLRINSDQAVRVTVLGKIRNQTQGRAIDISGSGIRIVVPCSFVPGDAVRIDTEDAMLLGDVCYCSAREGDFVIGVALDQALNGLADLARLNEALLLESGGERVILFDK